MQKGFILIILVIIWGLSTSLGNAAIHLHFLLGCQAVIPCQPYSRDSDTFKWFYKKDEHSHQIQILYQDKKGVQRYAIFRPRGSVTYNRSLVINNFTEDDEGIYWCENCYQHNCHSEESTVVRVKKEIWKEIQKTFYIIAGSRFEHTCPGEFTNLKWTFEASNKTAPGKSALRTKLEMIPSNKTIYIRHVTEADAGKYTGWTRTCGSHSQKIITINLCVITVHRKDSSVSCAVTCEAEFNNSNSTSNMVIGAIIISVYIDPYGSLTCSARQVFDGFTTITSSQVRTNAFNTSAATTGLPEHEYLSPVIYGASTALACLLLVGLLMFYFRSALRSAFPVNIFCCDLNGKVEGQFLVVYSSVVIRTPTKSTNSRMNDSECVYSEIKV